MGSVPVAGQAFFPLDDELELLPGALTPSLQEDLVHLGAWMPFGKAASNCAASGRRMFRGQRPNG